MSVSTRQRLRRHTGATEWTGVHHIGKLWWPFVIVISNMMLLFMSMTTTLTAFSVNTIVDNVDKDDERILKKVEAVVQRHNETMLLLT